MSNPNNKLYFINNSLVNDRGSGNFLYVQSGSDAIIQNNIFAKNGNVINGKGNLVNNLVTNNPGFADIDNYDYHLTENSIAINAGSDPGIGDSYDLSPEFQYKYDLEKVIRPKDAKIDIGAFEYGVTALDNKDKIPVMEDAELFPNYPNPFNPMTIIPYKLNVMGEIDIDIYNIFGQKILTLISKIETAGNHTIEWQASNVPAGIYLCRLSTEDGSSKSQKLILLK